MKRYLVVVMALLMIAGCAMVKEGVVQVAGLSTKSIEEARKDAITQTFNTDSVTCYNKVQEILKSLNSYVYARSKDKSMLALYVSQEDTTPVGIFFTAIDAINTKLEVSSPSAYAKEHIANLVFIDLVKQLNPAKKPEAGLETKTTGS